MIGMSLEEGASLTKVGIKKAYRLVPVLTNMLARIRANAIISV